MRGFVAAPHSAGLAAMTDQKKTVLSEDPNAGLATPVMDLTAAGIIAAIGALIVIESLRLPVPGGIMTAPGLLPFLTAASLLIMALILGANAIKRRRTIDRTADCFEIPPDFIRSLSLGGIVVVYVAALQFIPIDTAIRIGPLRFAIGAFETVSMVAITGILRLYWQRPLWACLAVTFGWIAFLSIVFRMVFETPLP
jgi:heme A synthase